MKIMKHEFYEGCGEKTCPLWFCEAESGAGFVAGFGGGGVG
ncbi:MAG: hypothetical protein AB8F94_03835 [Saprospiraceae bacterium]